MVPQFRVRFDTDGVFLFSEMHLQRKEYLELLEFFESILDSKPKKVFPLIERQRNSRNQKLLKVGSFSLVLCSLLICKYLTSGLNHSEDWLVVFYALILFSMIFWLNNLADSSTSKHRRENSKILSLDEAKALRDKWSLIMYSPCIIGLISFLISQRFPRMAQSIFLHLLYIRL